MAALAIAVTRTVLGLIGRRDPSLAGRLAFRLFSRTPPARAMSPKARAILAREAPRMAQTERRRLALAGGSVVAYRFGPGDPAAAEDRPVDEGRADEARAEPGRAERDLPAASSGCGDAPVLVVHGWGSQSAFMLPLIDALRMAGHTVVAVDLPGHGASGGRTLHMGQAVMAIDAAWREFGPFSAVVGHSFGGAAAIAAALGVLPCVPARRPGRLVTIAAPSALVDLFDRFSAIMALDRASDAAFRRRILEIFGRPLSAFDGAAMLRECRVETLVVHAADDKEVAFAHAEAYAGAGPHVRLVRADGHGHRRIVAARPVHAVVTDFLGAGARVPRAA